MDAVPDEVAINFEESVAVQVGADCKVFIDE